MAQAILGESGSESGLKRRSDGSFRSCKDILSYLDWKRFFSIQLPGSACVFLRSVLSNLDNPPLVAGFRNEWVTVKNFL